MSCHVHYPSHDFTFFLQSLDVYKRQPFSASALNYTIESLDDGDSKDQRHSPEVEKADFTNFCIDKAQTGLACVNSWGAIALEKYRLPYQDYELSFIMTPVYPVSYTHLTLSGTAVRQ